MGAIPFKIFIPYPDFLVFVSVLLAQKQPKQKVHAYKFPVHMFCKKQRTPRVWSSKSVLLIFVLFSGTFAISLLTDNSRFIYDWYFPSQMHHQALHRLPTIVSS